MRHASVRFTPLLMSAALLLVSACAPATTPSPTSGPKPAPTAAAPKPAATTAPTAKPAATAEAPKPVAPAAPAAKASAVTFQGKTVTLLLGWSPGGSADIMARQFVPIFQKHLPGNPTVVVQNMPGASEMVGDNWLVNVGPKDGTVIGQVSTIIENALFTPEQVKYDLAALQWLGSVSETQVTFVRADLGVKNPRDLVGSGKKIVLGDTGLTRGLSPRMFLSLVGEDYKYVTGFGSSGDARAAIQRGEINMTADALSGYAAAVVPLVQQGVVVPLAQAGLVKAGKVVRDPRVPDIPTFDEAALALKGEGIRSQVDYRVMELMGYINTIRRGWVYAPSVPQETTAAVREAIVRALADPALHEGYEKSVGTKVDAMDGKETQQAVDAMVARVKSSQELLERIQQLAKHGS